jgi:hypothetical protein
VSQSLTVRLNMVLPQGDRFESETRFKRHASQDGRDMTSAVVRLKHEDGNYYIVAYGDTKIGKRDVGRYSFWAGARISFERALDRMRERYSEALVRKFRHGVQIETALAENDEAGQQTHEKLQRLMAQRDSLLAEKGQIIDEGTIQNVRDIVESMSRVRPVPVEPILLPRFEAVAPKELREQLARVVREALDSEDEQAQAIARSLGPLPDVSKPEPEPDFRASTPRDTTLPAGRGCGPSVFGYPVVIVDPPVLEDEQAIALVTDLLGPYDTFSTTADAATVEAVRRLLQIAKSVRE